MSDMWVVPRAINYAGGRRMNNGYVLSKGKSAHGFPSRASCLPHCVGCNCDPCVPIRHVNACVRAMKYVLMEARRESFWATYSYACKYLWVCVCVWSEIMTIYQANVSWLQLRGKKRSKRGQRGAGGAAFRILSTQLTLTISGGAAASVWHNECRPAL